MLTGKSGHDISTLVPLQAVLLRLMAVMQTHSRYQKKTVQNQTSSG